MPKCGYYFTRGFICSFSSTRILVLRVITSSLCVDIKSPRASSTSRVWARQQGGTELRTAVQSRTHRTGRGSAAVALATVLHVHDCVASFAHGAARERMRAADGHAGPADDVLCALLRTRRASRTDCAWVCVRACLAARARSRLRMCSSGHALNRRRSGVPNGKPSGRSTIHRARTACGVVQMIATPNKVAASWSWGWRPQPLYLWLPARHHWSPMAWLSLIKP